MLNQIREPDIHDAIPIQGPSGARDNMILLIQTVWKLFIVVLLVVLNQIEKLEIHDVMSGQVDSGNIDGIADYRLYKPPLRYKAMS